MQKEVIKCSKLMMNMIKLMNFNARIKKNFVLKEPQRHAIN